MVGPAGLLWGRALQEGFAITTCAGAQGSRTVHQRSNGGAAKMAQPDMEIGRHPPSLGPSPGRRLQRTEAFHPIAADATTWRQCPPVPNARLNVVGSIRVSA